MPPTSDALSFHVKRSHYQVMIWHDAHYDTPLTFTCWQGMCRGLQYTLIQQEPIPTACLDFIHCSYRKCTKPITASAENPDCIAPNCMNAIRHYTSQNTENQRICLNIMQDDLWLNLIYIKSTIVHRKLLWNTNIFCILQQCSLDNSTPNIKGIVIEHRKSKDMSQYYVD